MVAVRPAWASTKLTGFAVTLHCTPLSGFAGDYRAIVAILSGPFPDWMRIWPAPGARPRRLALLHPTPLRTAPGTPILCHLHKPTMPLSRCAQRSLLTALIRCDYGNFSVQIQTHDHLIVMAGRDPAIPEAATMDGRHKATAVRDLGCNSCKLSTSGRHHGARPGDPRLHWHRSRQWETRGWPDQSPAMTTPDGLNSCLRSQPCIERNVRLGRHLQQHQ